MSPTVWLYPNCKPPVRPAGQPATTLRLLQGWGEDNKFWWLLVNREALARAVWSCKAWGDSDQWGWRAKELWGLWLNETMIGRWARR
eukprot:2734445-Rhodomonas_salina.2